ncbi:flagellar hook-basal body protein [Melioribacteraceae bacterium 4301-Me]|uniref:flagellar hook-basal body protein n=1 Tax=Pyranulibacter aquaticus TaxID=3163344 RepID=UPI00359768BB
MVKGIYAAARTLEKNNKLINIIANNLANMNSIGFKKDSTFSHIIDSYNIPQLSEYTDYTQGELEQTSNPLDLALKGKVFFALQDDNGEIYFTRNGKFTISENGYIVNGDGLKLLGKNGPINTNDNFFNNNEKIQINKNGNIKIGDIDVDSLLVVKFENDDQLTKVGADNYKITYGSYLIAEDSDFEVQQGYLENSNVNAIEEMENMIKVSKDFESAQKVMNYIDNIMEKATEIGKV